MPAAKGSARTPLGPIMKQIPRYDPANVDPLSLKAALSQLFNTTLTELWMTCPLRDKIAIGSHNIDCTGAIQESRYRQPKTGKFDGIHMLGNSGQKAYTKSVLNILSVAKLTSDEYDFHQSCSQYQFQYQKKQTSYKQNDKNKSQRENKNNNFNRQPDMRKGHEVPTSNRFEAFFGHNQENY